MALPLSLLPSVAHAVDISTRCDAIAGCLVGERDYVASFLATLRGAWRLLGGSAELFTAVLQPGSEQLIGCDFAIVFQAEDAYKLVLIEAKWARPNWDKRKRTSAAANAEYLLAPQNISRFSDQIARQAAWLAANPGPFVAEMFIQINAAATVPPPYNDPAYFDQLGSTFITHQQARQVIAPPLRGGMMQFPPTQLWHVGNGFGSIQTQALARNSMNAEALFSGVVECRFGVAMNGQWQDHVPLPPGPEGLPPPQALLQALGLNQILVVNGQRPPQWA